MRNCAKDDEDEAGFEFVPCFSGEEGSPFSAGLETVLELSTCKTEPLADMAQVGKKYENHKKLRNVNVLMKYLINLH